MSIAALRGLYAGQTGQIVGKGPSLRYLQAQHFVDGPVLTINDAIARVQKLELAYPLYSLQKDGIAESMVKPRANVTLILQSTPGYSGEWFPQHPKRILVEPCSELGFDDPSVMSIRMAAAILRLMGCKEIVFLCCDSFGGSDLRSYNAITGGIDNSNSAQYAAAIPLLLADLKDFPYNNCTPEPNYA